MLKPYNINDLMEIRAHFPDDLRGSRFFLTGAGSWFGTWVTAFLDYAGIHYERWMKPYDTFPTGAFDYVIHLAQARTYDVMKFAEYAQAKAVLFTSSGSVHNPDPDAKSNKASDEHIVAESGMEWRIARCYSFIGPGCPPRYAAGAFIRQALKGEPLTVKNAGTSIRTYLYIADLVAWLMTILLHGERGIYDVAGYEPVTTIELAQLVNKVTGNKGLMITEKDNNDIRPIYTPDPLNYQRSRKLGLGVWTDLETAIGRTVAYYL